MGTLNGSHYTNYPPLNQFCFWIATVLSEHSIMGATVVLRLIIITAEIGILVIGRKLLLQLKLPVANLFYYALNPFVIIELTGNLHFEAVLLFFLVYSLYLLQKNKWITAAIFLAFSVSVKLIPLLFLPLFAKYFMEGAVHKTKALSKLLWFYLVVFGTVLLTFAPFLSKALIANYSASVGLWFNNFEFNASFYYLFRAIGYTFRGYNEIATIGKILPILTVGFLSYLSFKSNRSSMRVLLQHMLFALTFYYFFSTTVHPWYLATLVLLSIFTSYKYPLVWSFVIVLSYQTYANTPWQENLWFVGAEYCILFIYMYWEFKGRKNKLLKSKG
ncbi:mannosyltransferase [Tenacibaculum sp. SG-28]|uniref:mannosyltransferase n=1 Tax=Tenacibaculum sp. SG-28 TaxID=754426 RepID=UPI002689C57F